MMLMLIVTEIREERNRTKGKEVLGEEGMNEGGREEWGGKEQKTSQEVFWTSINYSEPEQYSIS